MGLPIDIRQYYTPNQPSVSGSAGDVEYKELLPHESLRTFIYCYWQLRTTKPLDEPFVYRVVADGCIDIYFEPDNPAESYVMGFCRKFTSFELSNSFNYIGIRFLPTAFPQLFKINAKELRDRYQLLYDVLPDTATFITSYLSNVSASDKIKSILDEYFLAITNRTSFNDDARLYEAIYIILKKRGTLNIETDLDTGISIRQLRRLFEYYIGDTAKTFAKVVRFQNILKAKPSVQSLRNNKLFFDVGYYDQAHFIKEFKTFYGATPTQAFGR